MNLITNYNYYENDSLSKEDLKGVFNKSPNKVIKDLFSSVYELTNKSENLNNFKIFEFKNKKKKYIEDEKLILKLYSRKELDGKIKYFIQTGLYTGIINYNKYKFNIKTNYGNNFLKRMLNFANDIYLDNDFLPASKKDDLNEFQFVLVYLFLQSFEKAAILGLPNEYQLQSQRSHKVRGKINLNEYLKKDIPFKGKISTTCREQNYVQSIIDVLHLTLRLIENKFGKEINYNLLGVKQLVKQHYSGHFINIETILKAKNHHSLNNPMFSSYRKVLEYAEILLLNYDLEPSELSNNLNTTGYLIDISQLFEVYLEKLFRYHLTDWTIYSQTELYLYNDKFYNRLMYPDLILKHRENGRIIVLDAKFKKMSFCKKDIDREDFYQIHTYIQYFEPNVIMGGLIYPLNEDPNVENTYAQSLFGHENRIDTKFIIDGIYISKEMSIEEIKKSEECFIERFQNFIK